MEISDLHGATLRAYHDGHGWCIRAERAGDEPFLFAGYAVDARTAHWGAEQVAASSWAIGCKVEPLWLN